MSHARGHSFDVGGQRKVAIRNRQMRAIKEYITQNMCRQDDPDPSAAFICGSALSAIWDEGNLKAIISDNLTKDQIRHIRNKVLPFLSFLVWINVEDWFDHFIDRVFDGKTGHAANTTDLTLPMDKQALLDIGLPVTEVNAHWQQQFLFCPATIRFDDLEEVQMISNSYLRLPFVKRDTNALHGGYGKVEFCDIASEYVQARWEGKKVLLKDPSLAVAVKTFEVRDDAADEVRNLKLLKSSLTKNKSIALHLVLIDHASHYLILFPRAELGDLWQFLYCGNPPDDAERKRHDYCFEDRFPYAGGDTDITSALLTQSRNLADALKFLHTPRWIADALTFCAHMDLKPDNILIYDGGKDLPVGYWKICDFGISAFKEDEDDLPAPSGSVGDLYLLATMRIRAKRSEGSYQPPEVAKLAAEKLSVHDSSKARRRIGRKGDIWSFGAIFAEILSFAIKRDVYVKEFRQYRVNGCYGPQKDDYFYSKADVPQYRHALHPNTGPHAAFQRRPAVEEWLRKVASEASAPRHSIDCWAQVILQTLQVNVEERPDASRLVEMVNHVYLHMVKSRQSKDIVCEFVDPMIPPPNRPLPPMDESALARRPKKLEMGRAKNSAIPPIPDLKVRAPTFESARQPSDEESEHQEKGEDVPEESSGSPRSKPASQFYPPQNNRVPSGVPFTTEEDGGFPHMQPRRRESELSTRDGNFRRSESSQPSISSPSFIIGKPTNAFGILYGEDRKRRALPLQSQKLKHKPKGIKALSVDVASSDKPQVALLSDSSVSIFQLTLGGTISVSSPSIVPLPDGKGHRWTSVALAGDYLLAWGKRSSDETAMLYIAVKGNTEYTPLHIQPEDDILNFDQNKRVALSRMGFAALIRRRKLIIIDLQLDPPGLYPRGNSTDSQTFTDVAFNDEGDLLYAWATGSAERPYGGLFVYRATQLSSDRPESKGYYRCEVHDKTPTTVVPYNDYLGCIISANGRMYYPAVIRASSLTDTSTLPRHHSEAVLQADVKAACMYNNHSLITVQKINLGARRMEWHYRLVEYPLRFGEVHLLGDPIEIAKLDRIPDNASEVRAVQYDGDIFIFVVHADGHFEWITFQALDRTQTKDKGKAPLSPPIGGPSYA
ncbi:hypothetical protein B0H63DRAFT_477458 [Podospora didyma]|uniref:non-specific serine/threonine protein kinase n=1 Tax=Podospora didyma TaxID=330526 RepID=A0AAE0KIW6_9PEZI|nr:hypothetical protein B0H63DRAFT_477458 [Podospora didyma]